MTKDLGYFITQGPLTPNEERSINFLVGLNYDFNGVK